MRFFRSRALRRLALLAALLMASSAGPGIDTAAQSRSGGPAGEATAETLALSSDLRVRVRRGRDIELEVEAVGGDSYETAARRVGRDPGLGRAIRAWNGDRDPGQIQWVRIPLVLLSGDYRSLVLISLFPDDRREGEDWIHVARSGQLPTYDVGLWQIAEWFTGSGDAFVDLMQANALSSPEVHAGQAVRIPYGLLHPALRNGLVSADGELAYESDEHGPYAAYRLKPGEALYSAVVVRYTGRTKAADVVTVAEQIKERSGIRDLRDIPVGYKVKIPLELLEPEYLPQAHPRRLEAEKARRELEKELARRPVESARQGLEGVVVILDPGHGGRDLGTMNNGIWEHDFAYDVTCRLKEMLERRTSAKVYLTLEDEKTGCVPSRTDKLKANQQGTIKTHPPFLAKEAGEAKIGVNLRWYLANSIYRREVAAGVDPDKIVFLSIHADARHPSLRGVMVYVPGARYRAKTYGFKSKTYTRYAEVREKQYVTFSKKQRVRSEAVSQHLASEIVRSFRDGKLPVQPYQPVRNRIIRGRSVFVPAVLRGNAVPTKVLVEMVNLSNTEDAAMLALARDRERLAAALLASLRGHYGAGH